MDPKTFSSEEFSNMTLEEKKAAVHDLLTLGNLKDSRLKAVLFDKSKGKMVDISSMIETYGVEKVEEMILSTLENAECQASAVSSAEFHTILEKCVAGTATDEEREIAALVVASMKQSMGSQFKDMSIQMVVETLLDLFHFVKHKNYDVEYEDVLNGFTTLLIGSMLNTPGGALERFKTVGPVQMLNMLKEIAADIEKALTESIWKDSMPAPEFAILGLMTYVQKIMANAKESKTASMTFMPAKTIADFFEMDHEFNDWSDESDENPFENGNGSNEGNVAQPVCHCNECGCGNCEEKDSENS